MPFDSKDINILMLGGARRVSLARHIKRAAEQLNRPVHLYSYELETDVAIACEAKVIIGRRWNDPGLFDDIDRIVSEKHIDIIIPFVDGAIEPIARYAELHRGLYIPVSKPELCAAMYDKAEADAFFRAKGFPVPQLRSAAGPYPVIAKPRTGSASKGIIVLHSPADIDKLTSPAESYIFQEYIAERDEYTVDCFTNSDGYPYAIVPRRRVEVMGGEVVRSTTVDDEELYDLADNILTACDFRGFVTLQFLRDRRDGRLMLMEVNPRPGGGIVCSIRAGADFAMLLLRDYLGLDIHDVSWSTGVETARFLCEAVVSRDSNARQYPPERY